MANISIARFGATTICHGGINYVLGGIIRNEALGASDEICIFEVTESEPTVGISSPIEISLNPRPLLVCVIDSTYKRAHYLFEPATDVFFQDWNFRSFYRWRAAYHGWRSCLFFFWYLLEHRVLHS